MNNFKIRHILTFVFVLVVHFCIAQTTPEWGDPPDNSDIPFFFKSKMEEIKHEVELVKNGEVKTIAFSPGGFPVYAVFYGEKENFNSQANYNSAVAARNTAYYAKKENKQKPVVYFVGPVHGQEVEGIVGLINLIHIAETGKDYRGKNFTALQQKLQQCRTIIIPCGNPDGRNRCPYESFLGLPTTIMTKYGQGTHNDGTLWGWPGAKSVHPMKGDVKILGAYFNNNGINIMQDEYFKPMADETSAILELARLEAPDITVSLHSHENQPVILQPAYIPFFMKKQVFQMATNLNQKLKDKGLASYPENWMWKPANDDEEFPPRSSFNLVSALHHISGTLAFTFECSHGCVPEPELKPFVTYADILDIQLTLYNEIFDYVLTNNEIKK